MSKKALVVIDVQNYYMNEHTKDLPQKISAFIENSDVECVVFTKFVNDKHSSLSKLLDWKESSSSPDTDIVEVLERFTTKNNVFVKNTYSIFKSKPFVRFLHEQGIKTLVLCGLDTDACILASAYEGFDLGFAIRVLEHLTLSHCGKEYEKSALRIINKNLQKE